MNTLPPKMEKMLRYQFISRIVIALFASILSVSIFSTRLGWTLVSFICAGIFAQILLYFGSRLSKFALQKIFYRNNYEELFKDSVDAMGALETTAASPEVEEFFIVKTDTDKIGTFQDAPFYEWIDIQGQDDATTYRATYFGTMDISKGINQPVPGDCVIVPPGILYQVQGPAET